jgi:hypothetical protein
MKVLIGEAKRFAGRKRFAHIGLRSSHDCLLFKRWVLRSDNACGHIVR